jgi:hypothetical protein
MRLAKPRLVDPPCLGRGRLRGYSAFYSSSFGLTQNPMVEDGGWITPADRTSFRTASGNAIGLQNPGPAHGSGTGYDDSVMYRTGVWPADQEVIITAGKSSPHDFQEIECIVRCDSAGRYYELNVAHDASYSTLVRSEGTGNDLADYTELSALGSVSGGVNNGDLIRLRIVGFTLTAEINHGSGWVAMGSPFTDTSGSKIASGNPGIGAFKHSDGSPDMADFAIAAVDMRGL